MTISGKFQTLLLLATALASLGAASAAATPLLVVDARSGEVLIEQIGRAHV